MAGITLSKTYVDKFFSILKNLDVRSKKQLIISLTESIEETSSQPTDFYELFGAWKGDEDSDEIVENIRSSRAEKNNQINFE